MNEKAGKFYIRTSTNNYSTTIVNQKGSCIENSIVEIQPLIDIVSLTLQTAFITDPVDGYRPVSLLLIAKPESGKTTVIHRFSTLPFVYYTEEITVKVLVDTVLRRAENKEIRFILIPDLLNCIKKQTYTREPLVQTLKSLIDEGLKNIQTFHKQYAYKTFVKCGLITAITRSEFYASQGRYSLYSDLKRYGFLSRMIPFSYEYPIDKIAKIFDYVMSGKADDNSKVVIPKIRQFKREKYYEPNPELFSKLQWLSQKLATYMDAYGIRTQKNLQKLCYANALINGRDHVTKEDVEKILYLGRWMNFDFNPLS
ncbi:MAG: hypothetical protein QXJ07_03380 [Candidatus Bathyarchaeia archaeon]